MHSEHNEGYLLDVDQLQLGDILLSTTNQNISRAIRFGLISPVSHAMLYVDRHSFIHADKKGVHSYNTQRVLFEKDSFCRVMRLKEKPSDEAIEKIINFARSKIGTKYSVPEAIKSALTLKTVEQSKKTFCSRLVAEAYEFGGFKISFLPSNCNPKEILNSDILECISFPLREATYDEIDFIKNTIDIPSMQENATNSIMDKITEITGEDISSFEDIIDILQKKPKFDEEICHICESSEYFVLWKLDKSENPELYSIREFAIRFGTNTPFIEKNYKESHESNLKLIKRYTAMKETYHKLYESLNLKYFQLQFELYDNLIKLANERERVLTMSLGLRS